jgi:hypothetical protein
LETFGQLIMWSSRLFDVRTVSLLFFPNEIAKIPANNNKAASPDVLEVRIEVPSGASLSERFDRLNDDTDHMLKRWKSPFQDGKTPTTGNESSGVEEGHGSMSPDGLPWKKNKYGDWVFSNVPGAEPLVELLKNGKTVIIGDYRYSLSGANQQFINRNKGVPKEVRKKVSLPL